MSRPAMIPNNENYHGLQHEPANRDDLREWRRMAMRRTTHSNGVGQDADTRQVKKDDVRV